MGEIKSLNNNQNTKENFQNFQVGNLIAKKTNCSTYWDSSWNVWREECTSTSDGSGLPVIIILIISSIIIATLLLFRGNLTKIIGNSTKSETKLKDKESKKFNNLDLESYIEELKETKFPDVSISESYLKGSYVILKDLNGKTIAEIKIPE